MATNLLDMILQAQGGASAQNAGQALGLDQNQTQSAIAALLPAISSALKMNTQQPQGLAGLLGALQNGNHNQYIEKPELMGRPETITDGNAILGHLFGSKEVSRAVAGRASEQTGIGSDVLKKLLPMVATMAMGSLSPQTQQPSMKGQLAQLAIGQLLGGGTQKASGLGGLLGGLLGGGQKRQRQAQQQQQQTHQQGLGMLGKMLDADGDGNVMDDVLKMAMNQMANR
jgi:hypothetical protein